MNSSSLKQHILDNIYGNEGLSRHQLQEKLARLGIDIEKTTLIRHLNKLVKSGELSRYGKGRATIYQQEDSLDAFFAKPPHLRPPVGYDVGIIERYRSDNGYFNRSELELLARNSEFKIANASTYLKNLYAKLVVDFSYASCHLEGNTYSFMDTQALIEHGEVAAGKSEEETIMVLNHRNAIDYLFANLATIRLTSSTIKEIHAILSLDLIQRHYVGVLRNGFVGIGASSYTPLANQDQLTDELELL